MMEITTKFESKPNVVNVLNSLGMLYITNKMVRAVRKEILYGSARKVKYLTGP